MLSTSRSAVRLDLQMDWRLIVFLAGAGSLVTFLFGVAPALRASAVSPNDALKSGSGRHTARSVCSGHSSRRRRHSASSCCSSPGCVWSASRSWCGPILGFDPSNLAIVNVEARDVAAGRPKALAVWEQLLERVQQTPGVESASLSGWGLFEGSGRNKSVRIPGRAVDDYDPWYLPVSPRFLKTMRIRLLDGRDFEWRDARPELPSAVIVNESFARRYFPGESALGKRFFRVDGGATLVLQDIIGVAGDAKYTSLREAAPPTVYDPYRPGTVRRRGTGANAARNRRRSPRCFARSCRACIRLFASPT